MPIAYEVAALALFAYGIGLAIGWALFARSAQPRAEEDPS